MSEISSFLNGHTFVMYCIGVLVGFWWARSIRIDPRSESLKRLAHNFNKMAFEAMLWREHCHWLATGIARDSGASPEVAKERADHVDAAFWVTVCDKVREACPDPEGGFGHE